MDWSLYRCGRSGHITYAPDETHLRDHMRARTHAGEVWRCLRCGAFVHGEPHGSGPAGKAPVIRRGKEIRSDLILRLFAIERILRFVLFAALAYGIYRFASSRVSITQAFNRELPIVRSFARQMGYNVDHSSVISLFQRVLHINPSRLTEVAVAVAALSVVSLIEGIGLWLAKRWGEYFAFVVTFLGLPLEIYELIGKQTITKIVFFVLNIILVLYLVLNRRLFGVRGGKEAYEARVRGDSILDEAAKLAAGARSWPGPTATPATVTITPGQAVPGKGPGPAAPGSAPAVPSA